MKQGLKFSGKRRTQDIKRACHKRGLSWDASRYENGSDYVTFEYRHYGSEVRVIYNTFNGTFMVKHGDEMITEKSTHMDEVGWYRGLLRFIYIEDKGRRPKGKSAAAR